MSTETDRLSTGMMHIELLKSILEQWDSDSGHPLANFFYNNTQTHVLCYSQPLPKSTNKIKTKQAH